MITRKTIWNSLAVAAALLMLLTVDGLAQRKIAEYQELSDLKFKAREGLYDRQRRVETTDEKYEGGVLKTTEYQLEEWLADDHWRDLKRSMTDEGAVERETILIGHFRYERKNQEPWIKIDTCTEVPGYGSGSGSVSGGCSVSQLTVEPVFLGNFPARMFEYLRVKNSKDGMLIDEERTWIGDNGGLLQEEMLQAMLSPRQLLSRSLVKYEFEPNIRISAPIP